ncbi:ATP-grasp domain-containing protein [Pectobacterium polonicum]|uniref:ATP-grasp domain-containing protein n=1 Tax=Pectobacterium polonicum TaxID=2485124 RepID=A0AAE9NUN2_9GAMM|nr:ATP-grasp domain-containing protein [Pectobacterium polonicum]UVO10032.1 ATP-grasp domain-containing protein [Pectobacterium polonicum]
MKHLVFIDANNSAIQCMDEALNMGYKVSFIQQEDITVYQVNEFSNTILRRVNNIINVNNATDENELIIILSKILEKESIDGVIASNEPTLEAVSAACKKCGIFFTNPQGVKNARNKFYAREILRKCGIATVNSWVANSMEEARKIFEENTPPFIFKPVSGFDSLHAFKVESLAQLDDVADEILSAAKINEVQYADIFSRGILVEEFIHGKLLSAEVAFYDEKFTPLMISGRSQSKFNECIELGSLMPADVSEEEKLLCFQYAEDVCRALGLNHGIFHIELMYTKRGPILVEANPRLMGGVMPEIYKQSTGFSIYPNLFNIYANANSDVSIYPSIKAVTVRKIIPVYDGYLSDKFDISDLKNHPNIVNFYSDKITPQRKIGKNEVLGRIMVAHADLDNATEIADNILNEIGKRIGIELHTPC